jgi:hypothetical protein
VIAAPGPRASSHAPAGLAVAVDLLRLFLRALRFGGSELEREPLILHQVFVSETLNNINVLGLIRMS